MDGPILEPEQRQLFSAFVEVLRSRPRSEREEFMVIRAQADLIQGNGFSGEVLGSDILHLGEVGLLRITDYHRRGSGFNFYIPPEGLEYYQHLKGQTDEPVEQVETEVRTYLEAFRDAYPDAYNLWGEAEELLWGADSEQQLFTIGHKCREAIQKFATALIERHQPPSPTATRRRPAIGSRPLSPSVGRSSARPAPTYSTHYSATGKRPET